MYLIKRPNGIYAIEFFDFATGKTKRVTTGARDKKTAQKFLQSFNPYQQMMDLPKNRISLSEFYDEYLKYVGNTHTKSYNRSIKLSFNQFIKFTGDIQLHKIDIRLVQQFISETFSRASYSAGLYLRTLKAAFNRAVEWEYITSNPFLKVKVPKVATKQPVFITESEFELLIANTSTDLFRTLFNLAYNTGMRLGEIVNLRWESVNLKDKFIIVANTEDFTTKSKKERIIPIANSLLEILTEYETKSRKPSNKYVFEKILGIRLNEDFVSKKFKEAVREANLPDKYHFHTHRHSFASRLVQKGVPLYVVKELMGHSDIATTQIYSHLRKENLVEAIQVLD